MSEQSKDTGQIRILTDEVELENPIYFRSYCDVLVKVIQGSSPRFSIGIYGDWGTGKTTLMRLIKNELEGQNNILPVWLTLGDMSERSNLQLYHFSRPLHMLSLKTHLN